MGIRLAALSEKAQRTDGIGIGEIFRISSRSRFERSRRAAKENAAFCRIRISAAASLKANQQTSGIDGSIGIPQATLSNVSMEKLGICVRSALVSI